MAKSPILGGFSTTRSQNAADNTLINMGVEVVETRDGKVPGYLFLQSGLDLVKTVGTGPIRGVLSLNGLMYLVSGQEVYSLTQTGVATLCGVISNLTTPVSMIQNKRQLLIVDGVGAWLVPGGLPLTAGTIDAPGALYAVNDEVTLLAASGSQSSFPVIEITAVADNPVMQYTLANAGTTYNSATGVATTALQPQIGGGSGFVVNITAVTGGAITTATVNVGGADFAVGDTGVINAGNNAAFYQVTGVTTGAVTSFRLLSRGGLYAVQSGVSTDRVAGIAPNSGAGLTFDTTASSGPITATTIANGGFGFAIGNAGVISGGTADATYYVSEVGPFGTVTAFTIIQPGSVDTAPTSFSQKSTTGSGSGLTISSLSFGAFVGLVPITVPFANPTVGDVSDGFGLLVFQGLQDIAQSDELDLSTWPPLSFGVSNQSPDDCISIHVVHDEAYIFKEGNTEVWVNQGTPNFAFAPLTSVHLEVGIAAPFSVAVADEDVIWLSRDNQGQGQVVSATGYRDRVISTQALTNEIQKYATIEDAQAYVRQEGGHVYYVLTFPSANKTWVYDKTTSTFLNTPIWFQLAAFENGQFNRHWGNAFYPWSNNMTAQGAQGVLGDYRNGNLYAFNPLTLTDNGTRRKWLRRWRALAQATYNSVKFSWLALKVQTGIGVPGGTEPQVVLSWSDDDGYTFSDERIQPAGKSGETAALIKFNRLGTTRRFKGSDRIFEISSSDPFITALLDAEVDAV